MPDHASGEPMLSRTEPAAVAEGARIVLGALIALGWVSIDSATTNGIITAVGAVASVLLTAWTRNRVTPAAKLHEGTAS